MCKPKKKADSSIARFNTVPEKIVKETNFIREDLAAQIQQLLSLVLLAIFRTLLKISLDLKHTFAMIKSLHDLFMRFVSTNDFFRL